MARITVEDCLREVDNRFALIHLAAKRVRQLRKGSEPLVVCKNKDTVTALREIAAGRVVQDKSSAPASPPESMEMPFFMPLSEVETAGEADAAETDADENSLDVAPAEETEPDPAKGEGPA